MSRSLRGLLLGSIAIAFVYLVVHAREPLRLNIGDPWSDANVLTSINHVKSDGFLAFYGVVGKYLGVSDIGTLRLFGLMFSSLAMWLLFSYVRRLYSDRVALIATALFSTSLLWMMYADSLDQAPVMQCTGFLALWGLVRAIETRQRRHYAAAIVGSFACFFASYDYFVFLPAAVLVTVYLKVGNPFARGNRHLVALCGLGCLVGIVAKCLCMIGAVGWNGLVADLQRQFLEGATSTHDRKFTSAIPTMVRRITLVFTPFAWLTAAYHVLKAIRAPNLAAALKDTAVWMLLAALAFLYLFAQLVASQLLASQMLASQVLLPFYAIGSALVLDRLLDASPPLRRFAILWLAAAPLWSFYFMFTHPRSVLHRDDVANTNAYLAANDHNDFVMSNLLSDAPIQAAFQRHNLGALDAVNSNGAPRDMMRIFELTGADHVHVVIFTDPDSRFIDRSLWSLAMPRGLWAIAGAPHMHRAKTNAIIADYDQRVAKNLKAVHATKVLQLSNYEIFRVDRATVMAILADTVPTANHLDFTSVNSLRHELLGWDYPELLADGTLAATISGMERCPAKRCKTVVTKHDTTLPEPETISMGQVMIRVDPVCDLKMTFRLARPGYARASINGFSPGPLIGTTLTFVVPATHLIQGVNVVELQDLMPRISGSGLRVASLDLEPACTTP